MLRSKQSRAYWFLLDGGSTAVYLTLQLPKPMFEFAFEGELLPFIVNGDRYVLFALLPRRKPRTPVSAAALLCSKNYQPHQLAATPIHLPHLAAGLDFCFVDAGPHLHTMLSIPRMGFTRQKNRGHPTIGMTSVSDFSHPPTALRRYLHPSFQSGPRCRAGFRFRPWLSLGRFTFSFSGGSLASLVTGVYVSGFCNRCRSRCTRPRPRANCRRSASTETGP